MTDHKPWETLCALAATGQLTGSEQIDFDDHYSRCPTCRRHLQDLIALGMQLQLNDALRTDSAPMPAGSLERFRARAIHEGIALRPAPARSSSFYALTTAAAAFFIVAMLIVIPVRRKAMDRQTTSFAALTPIRQSLPEPITLAKLSRPSTTLHTRLVPHKSIPHVESRSNQPELPARQFPQVLAVSYPFFERQSVTKPLPAEYPTLSQSQISHLALFSGLHESFATNTAGTGISGHSVDIALAGKTFDFNMNLRQIYFPLPTAQ